jgi:hypothetical protein
MTLSRTTTLLAFALAASVGLAAPSLAQVASAPDQDHTSHHPNGQTPPPAPPPAAAPGGPSTMMGGGMSQMMRMRHDGMMQHDDGMGMMPFDHIEGRIAFYKAELGITDAQLPRWNAFADVFRGSAKGMRMAMGAMMQAGMPATGPARMEAMVQMMSARLDAMKAMLAAAKPLYAVLSDDQKKVADELMAEHPMGMRAMGMGER